MLTSAENETLKLTPSQAACVLAGLVAVLAVYLYAASLLGLAALFTGNILLFYWASIERFKPAALPATVVGALGGIVTAALFVWLPPTIGPLAGLILLLAAIYCVLMGWLRLFFNNAYLLFVNVVLIPSVLSKGGFLQMAAAVLFSAVFWGALVVAGTWLRNRRAAPVSA